MEWVYRSPGESLGCEVFAREGGYVLLGVAEERGAASPLLLPNSITREKIKRDRAFPSPVAKITTQSVGIVRG